MQEIDIHQTTPNINIDTATRTYHLPIASETQLGGIKVGNNLTIEEDGTLNAESTEYNLPVATSSTLGGVMVGSGLSINEGSLSVNVDNSLSSLSSNPVQNSVVSSNISTLTTGLQTVSNNLTTLGNNFTTLSNTVSGHTTSITNLETTVGNHTTAIQTNTDNIANNTSAITNTNGNVSALSGRMDTAEDNITNLTDSVNTINNNLIAIGANADVTVTYSYLLPINTFTSGQLTISTRNYMRFVTFDLECTLTLATSTVIYTLETPPAVDSYSTLNTDAGVITVKVDSTTGEISLVNMGGTSLSITKILGSVPLMDAHGV